MRAKYYKDQKFRYLFLKNELKYLYLQYLDYFNFNFFKNIKFNKFQKKFMIKTGKYRSRINSRCLITNRSKAVFRKFHLSRIILRQYILNGYFAGIKKSSF